LRDFALFVVFYRAIGTGSATCRLCKGKTCGARKVPTEGRPTLLWFWIM